MKILIPPKNDRYDFITPETPFSTRHFTVFFDSEGNIQSTFTDSIYAISEEAAISPPSQAKPSR